MENFLGLLVDGGPLMIPILLCSVVALGVFLERIFYLRRKKIIPQELVIQVEELVKKERISDVTNMLKRDRSPMARIFLAAVNNFGNKVVHSHFFFIFFYEGSEIGYPVVVRIL